MSADQNLTIHDHIPNVSPAGADLQHNWSTIAADNQAGAATVKPLDKPISGNVPAPTVDGHAQNVNPGQPTDAGVGGGPAGGTVGGAPAGGGGGDSHASGTAGGAPGAADSHAGTPTNAGGGNPDNTKDGNADTAPGGPGPTTDDMPFPTTGRGRGGGLELGPDDPKAQAEAELATLNLSSSEQSDVNKLLDGFQLHDSAEVNSVIDKYQHNAAGYQRIETGAIDESILQDIKGGSLSYGYSPPTDTGTISINYPGDAPNDFHYRTIGN